MTFNRLNISPLCITCIIGSCQGQRNSVKFSCEGHQKRVKFGLSGTHKFKQNCYPRNFQVYIFLKIIKFTFILIFFLLFITSKKKN